MSKLFFIILFLVMAARAEAAPRIVLKSVEHVSAGRQILVYINLAQPSEFKAFSLKEPDRVVIDLVGVILDQGSKSQTVNDAHLSCIRFAQFTPEVVRVVLDLTAPCSFQAYRDESDACRVIVAIDRPKSEALIKSVLTGRIIALDPGHGSRGLTGNPYDCGSIGPTGALEADVSLAIALQLEKLLIEAGAEVVMTRRGKSGITLSDRVSISEKAKPDILVSIHANSALSSDAKGTETLYSLDGSKDLAYFLQKSLVSSIMREDRGIKKQNIFILNGSTVPAAMVEVAFINNPEEERLLSSPDFQAKAAEGVFNGIVSYFESISEVAL